MDELKALIQSITYPNLHLEVYEVDASQCRVFCLYVSRLTKLFTNKDFVDVDIYMTETDIRNRIDKLMLRVLNERGDDE